MNKRPQGFTLLELLVTVVITAILLAVALPSYQNYIKKSRAQAAGADLVALGLAMENIYQRTLQYTTSTTMTTADTINYIASGTSIQPWSPAQNATFSYTLTATSSTYTLSATGITSTTNNGCTLTLSNLNTRSITAASSTTSACGGLTTW